MVNLLKRILLNRNSILVFAVIAGIVIGEKAVFLKNYSFVALALTMSFSMTGISLKHLKNPVHVTKQLLLGIFFNYIVFSAVLIPLAWFLMPNKNLFYGFVVIAAAPPGVAIIPFSYILKGKVEYAIIGVTGAFLASILIAPLLVNLFTDGQQVKPFEMLTMMIQLVLLPMIISRLLLLKPIFRYIEPIRGKVVDWGFAIIIFVAVGMNRQVFFSNPSLLVKVSLVLVIAIFGLGIGITYLGKLLKIDSSTNLTQSMLVSIKSSGFSVFTALTLFGKEAAIPSAIMAVMVLLYLIYLSLHTIKTTKE